MKCPKCHYLSFEPEPRCRNCGYSLNLVDAPLDLPMRPETPVSPAPLDFELSDGGQRSAPARDTPASDTVVQAPSRLQARNASPATVIRGPGARPRPVRSAPRPQAPRVAEDPDRSRPAPASDLPLFMKTVAEPGSSAPHEDLPVPAPVQSRPPIAVRMTPEAPGRRAPASSLAGPLDRDLLEGLQRLERERVLPVVERQRSERASEPVADDRAGAGRRLAAAAIDAALLSLLSAAVVWATLRWCDIPIPQAALLPIVPTAAFLALIALGYLILFTAAGGQTLGKMLAGIRVVSGQREAGQDTAALTLGQALSRACAALPSVLCLGLGFWPALVGDERAIHDRLAGTRVVRG